MTSDQTQKTVWTWNNIEPFGNSVLNDDPNSDGQPFAFDLRFGRRLEKVGFVCAT